MKKSLLGILALSGLALASCDIDGTNIVLQTTTVESTSESTADISSEESTETSTETTSSETSTETGTEEISSSYEYLTGKNESIQSNFDVTGYAAGGVTDYSKYYGTDAYVEVSTADELIRALYNAKDTYTNTYDSTTGTYTQSLTNEGSVKVIEITADIDLGYKTLSTEALNYGIVDNFASKQATIEKGKVVSSSMLNTYGISQVKIENTSNLLVFSKSGNKLTHAGFKLTSDFDVSFRNIAMDEIWQWEDSTTTTPNYKIGDYDCYGWAYFKIGFSGAVWIDHCSFGKSYDGQIDVSNPVYWTESTVSRAPYGADNESGVSITNCDFHAGEDDKDGYIYKMMEEVETDYQTNGENTSYQYYRVLREEYGLTFDQILYGIAIPQKKGFLLGDGTSESDIAINTNLYVSFGNCKFTNIEDRLPKLRSGFVYMYNCVVDNTQYYAYHTELVNAGVTNIKNTYSKFKCAMVSQGIIACYGGDVRCENCVFLGIEALAKNNEKEDTTLGGGVSIINCYYSKDGSTTPTLYNSDTNASAITSVLGSGVISVDEFNWHNDTNTADFTPVLYDVDTLAETLSTTLPVGVNTNLADLYLYSRLSYFTA